MIYDYVLSIEKRLTYKSVSSANLSTNAYLNTEKQKQFLPIVCVSLIGSSETGDRKRELVGATYSERQLHKATIPQQHTGIRTIRLQVLHASVKLWDITVHYKNGRKQIVEPPGIIYQNGESPVIDLKEESEVQAITFSLNAVTFSERTPVIWIWGR